MIGPTSSKSEIAAALQGHLEDVARLRGAAKRNPEELAIRQALRAWQSGRLERTYPDLLSSPRYGEAARFFQNDLYGDKDFSGRDADVKRIVPTLTRMLPAGALAVIAQAIELDALSESLDARMTEFLHRPEFGDSEYANAYRHTGRGERTRQIELIVQTGLTLDRLVKLPLLGTTLALMRTPAHLAGLSSLHDFLERGFNAFRRMGNASLFIATVTERERILMERLYAEEDEPFRAIDGNRPVGSMGR